MSPKKIFFLISFIIFALIGSLSIAHIVFLLWLIPILPLFLLGLYDMLQNRSTIIRNFPVIGHLRFLMEAIRPELQQYFVESNLDGRPISRELRSIVYQRSKNVLQSVPFGTQRDVYQSGYEWVDHAIFAKKIDPKDLSVTVGGKDCTQPYKAKIFNISAMSYGSLSKNAILALNKGAKMGGFYHNTGEGGLTPYHTEHGGDLVWQIGTAYFGCRTPDGHFCEKTFTEKSQLDSVKMIEIKLSQGAKPGHGGILPAKKVTKEIAEIRGVEAGKIVISPAFHSAFHDSESMLLFIQKLRTLSQGKPIGIKMCIGSRTEFREICSAMLSAKIYPDYITIDGAEGGTGAAPLEFTNHLGMPLKDAIAFVHDTLKEFHLRDQIVLIASGKIFTGFDMLKIFALGADITNSGRGMMLALGCIQALRCNKNTCPTGVATNDPALVSGLNVMNKSVRVFNYQQNTLKAFAELLGAMGLTSPKDVKRQHIHRRINSTQTMTYAEIYGKDS